MGQPQGTTTDPVGLVRLGVNSAYLVLAALVALAVGSELVITHPTGHGSATLALLLFGGPALCLATTAWLFGTTVGGAWKEPHRWRRPLQPPA
ncbi:low temperature requirement protein A [Streptomyces sp. NPDC004436]